MRAEPVHLPPDHDPRRARNWPDSPFTRLLLAQGMVLGSAMLIFGVMGTIERNVLLSRRYAALWEPALRQAMMAPVGGPAVPACEVPGGLRHELDAPFWRIPAFPATLRAAPQVLAPRGPQVEGIWLAVGSRGSPIWMAGP